MNSELFQRARSAYVAKDYETALAQFTDCLQDTSSPLAPGETGLLYHQIGNCLVKLNDPNEAIHAYSQAGIDSAYDALGSVNYNLGMVYASAKDYEDAVRYFQLAVENPKYATPYKAYMGMGNSLLKIGKSAEAGAAFRSAALDEANPDPTKALLNLGVCFMALNRPMDAIASYESALQFDMDANTRNRMFANMGQAYVAAGKMNKAVRAFESALADKTYVFNDAANVDYQRAVAAVAAGIPDEEEQKAPEKDLSGLDVSGDGVPYESAQSATPDTASQETSIMQQVPQNSSNGSTGDFFTPSQDGFEDWGKKMRKKHRNRGLKAAIVIILLIVLLAGGGLFAYTQGYGFPSKQEVVSQFFSQPDQADVFASSVSETQRSRMRDMVVADSSATIVGETNNMSIADVYVQATAPEGGSVPYRVSLERDGIGWKITDVELYFTSQHVE